MRPWLLAGHLLALELTGSLLAGPGAPELVSAADLLPVQEGLRAAVVDVRLAVHFTLELVPAELPALSP